MLILSPVGCLLALVLFELSELDLNWPLIVITGFILTVLFVLSNIFQYKKFPDILEKDFLGTKHHCSFKASQEKTLDKIMKIQYNSVILSDKQDDCGYRMYRISSWYRNVYLHIKFNKDSFELIIKSDWPAFIPDSERNYRFLEKLKHELKTKPNTK